jgi:hypothetical protein
MTPISVRQLSDGEELVLIEGQGSLGSSTRVDARGQLSERRNQPQSSAPGVSVVSTSGIAVKHGSAQ